MSSGEDKVAEKKEERPSLQAVLDNEELLASFDAWSKQHLCNEHLDFYRSVLHYKYNLLVCGMGVSGATTTRRCFLLSFLFSPALLRIKALGSLFFQF